MKAIALVSGGLDSALAAKIILDQGIEVIATKFLNPFTSKKQTFDIKHFAEGLNMQHKTVSLVDECLEMIKRPKFGFGSNLNPCIDCRILMLKKTKNLMKELDVSFVVSGEVLGQRPMSQHKEALKLVGKESNLEGLILRPLSAKRLDETIPEQKGWVNRDELFDFSGRSRKPQIALAKKLGIEDYQTPAGGCLLTDPGFCRRLKDFLEYSKDKTPNPNDIELLKLGRHFRMGTENRLIVGRNEEENNRLTDIALETDLIFEPVVVKGPIAIGRGAFDSSDILGLASQIVARYCDIEKGEPVKINLSQKNSDTDKTREIHSSAIDDKFLKELII